MRNEEWQLIAEGESKVVYRTSNGLYAVRLKPSLYSFTANRNDTVPGSEIIRLRISEVLWDVLRKAGISVAVVAVYADHYITEPVEVPNIEVIVKRALVGTPKHIYRGIGEVPTRLGEYLLPDKKHPPYVRFDWRNPLPFRDECLPEALADLYIDTSRARNTALQTFSALESFLGNRGIDILDICLFIDAHGEKVFGEISPDCMRAKHRGDDLDKDTWRKGEDGSAVISKWTEFYERITK